MIAMPIKTDSENSALAQLFGKAKFFALIDENAKITIQSNEVEGGMKVAQWFQKAGVTTLITNHLGEKPFAALQKAGIRVYFAGSERIEIAQALQKFNDRLLEEVSASNYDTLLKEEKNDKKSHGCHDSHEGAFRSKVKCCEKNRNPLASAHRHGHKEGECGEHGHHHEHGCCHHEHA